MSVWLPTLATDRLPAPTGNRDAAPLALSNETQGLHRIVRLNRAAARAGITPGMPLADARAMVPGLQTAPWDRQADADQLRRLAHWATRFSPWTRPWDFETEGDGLWLDISGCAHLFGGETALLKRVTDALSRAGYQARAAIADTAGAAWAVARHGSPSAPETRIIPPGAQRDALAALPVSALRLENAVCEGLERLGLTTVGALYPLPRASLALRFGLTVGERLDQALGRLFEPLDPLSPPPAYRTRMAFAEPIGTRNDLEAALGKLLPPLCDQLAQAGRGVRRLIYSLYRVDGSVADITIGTGRPARDADHLYALFRDKLDHVDPGFGVEAASLNAIKTDPQPAHQQVIRHDPHDEAGRKSVEELVDRLENRLPAGSVFRLRPWPSHLPEAAQVKTSPLTEPQERSVNDAGEHSVQADRPLYLLPTPEPLDVDAGRTPFGAPFAFYWRRRDHRLVTAEGPERLAPEWWQGLTPGGSDDPFGTRDYYRVEDEQGGRFWLFRDSDARWFLHGVFP